MPNELYGNPGDPVPLVDVVDLEAVWQVDREIRERHPGKRVGVGIEVYKAACEPGVDVVAVWFRLAMVTLLIMARECGDLTLEDDTCRRKVFEVAARIPMRWPPEGPHEATLDTEKFVRAVRSLP
jgi:hypothetical protein